MVWRAEVHPDNIAVTIICPGYVHTNVTLNALRGDGSANARMADDTRRGLPPDVFARRALRAIKRRRREALIGKKEILGVYIKRFFPGLLARIVRGMRVA